VLDVEGVGGSDAAMSAGERGERSFELMSRRDWASPDHKSLLHSRMRKMRNQPMLDSSKLEN
jgi:hypothetical protein